VQRYEGASTLYGPHTLDAYIQTVLELVEVDATRQWHGSNIYETPVACYHIGLCVDSKRTSLVTAGGRCQCQVPGNIC
jgi:hypothetical protein